MQQSTKKVLVTGARGFIGRNLVTALRREENLSVQTFDSTTPEHLLPELLAEVDVVFHLAGVNRPPEESEFARVNHGLTETLIHHLVESNSRPLVVFSSSRQAELDNPYGRSKKAAEDLLMEAHDQHGIPVCIYRLPGVFGKWSRPNYNTVVATFCHNIARGLDITISNEEHELELVYVDHVVKQWLTHLTDTRLDLPRFGIVPKSFNVTLGDLARRIREFHDVRLSLKLPNLEDELNRCLYPTYLSFLEEDSFSSPVELRSDERGWLFELIKSPSFGQIFVSTTHPGITRGNHYHDSKVEKFCLIQGEGVIRFRDLESEEIIDYPVNDKDIRVVDIPPGYTHSIENVGDKEMIVLFWSNQIFDPNNPDTYWDTVIKQ